METSPEIVDHAWGSVEVEGADSAYRDAKLFPGGSREWDWNETGTEHVPGIQPADIEELLEHGVEIVVLSQGVHERLQVTSEALGMLADRGVEAEVLRTDEAVERYNELARCERVGALIHSTC